MSHVHRFARVSKSLVSSNRPFTNDRKTLAQTGVPRDPHTSFAAQIKVGENKTFPADDNVFSQYPLIFDNHKMVCYLKAGGFTPAQSESITDAMVRVSQHSNRHHSMQTVTKNEFVSLRSELSILEKADFALLKTDITAIEKHMETSVPEIYTAV